MTKQIDELMKLADEYAKAWHASQTSRLIAAYDDGDHRKALKSALEAALKPGHVLYTTADKDRPDAICDRNGEVVLSQCKVCGKAESELDQPCAAPPAQTPAAPQRREPMTDEQIEEITSCLGFGQLSPLTVARAIEAAYGIGGKE